MSYAPLFTEANFKNTIEAYCAEHGWKPRGGDNDGAVLLFSVKSASSSVPLYIVRGETTVTFIIHTTQAAYSALTDIPAFLMHRALRRNLGSASWLLMQNDGKYRFCYNCEIESRFLDTNRFSKIVNALVKECGEMDEFITQSAKNPKNLPAEDETKSHASEFTEARFETTIKRYCAELNWTIARLNDTTAIIPFASDAGPELALFVIRREQSLLFSVSLFEPQYDDPTDVPPSIALILLKRNMELPIGAWCIQDHRQKQVLNCSCSLDTQIVSQQYFEAVAKVLVEEVGLIAKSLFRT